MLSIYFSGTPKIIYASRTHTQISQALSELKRTNYAQTIRAAVLGSRDQLCIHSEVMKEQNNTNKIHLCQRYVSARSCMFYNNVESRKEHPDFTRSSILDIEDLVSAGKKNKCCPYYMARELKNNADIIFMPYNYLLDPKARKANNIELDVSLYVFALTLNYVPLFN
jgi:regulator of telomere elongation helicase 1